MIKLLKAKIIVHISTWVEMRVIIINFKFLFYNSKLQIMRISTLPEIYNLMFIMSLHQKTFTWTKCIIDKYSAIMNWLFSSACEVLPPKFYSSYSKLMNPLRSISKCCSVMMPDLRTQAFVKLYFQSSHTLIDCRIYYLQLSTVLHVI